MRVNCMMVIGTIYALVRYVFGRIATV